LYCAREKEREREREREMNKIEEVCGCA